MGTRPWPADRPSPLLPDRSHGFMDLVFPAFRLQPPGAPGHRFGRSPRFTVTGFPAISAGETARHWGFAFGVQARRRHPAESSSLPTDRWFTSRCSPPHLAVGQLLSITGLRTWAWWGLAPHGPDTLTIAHPCRLAPMALTFFPFGFLGFVRGLLFPRITPPRTMRYQIGGDALQQAWPQDIFDPLRTGYAYRLPQHL